MKPHSEPEPDPEAKPQQSQADSAPGAKEPGFPEGWPVYLTRYPEGTIVFSHSQELKGFNKIMLGFESQNPPQEVFEYYLPIIEANGYKLLQEVDTGDFMLNKYSKDNGELQIQSMKEDKRTMSYIVMMIPVQD